ncbi:maleylacetoacetate isomerase [Benzoatithermus flavus]|uniref:Maleylacetoacetate isomerase n=1 Tax=Benzoatithermus flavus TaxID=3108223 RepID=A0ABU8XNK4_9PROT
MRLYDYWRSSAAYRVRIALNLKGISYEQVPVNLRSGGQRTLDYTSKNPQGLVPTLEDGGAHLTQSLAIIEYLDETHPEPPLLPKEPLARAQVRAMAQLVACEIHPLNNLRVLQRLEHRLGLDEREISSWYRHWINEGFAALEARLKTTAGRYAFGDSVTLVDLCLVPQLYNARRYRCDLVPFPTICRVEEACQALPAFDAARPERQPDAA